MFVGRRKELAKLEEYWNADSQKLVAIYGRRRIGKTLLIEEFMKDKKGISFTAFRGNKDLLLCSLVNIVCSYFNPGGPKYNFT